MPLFYIDTETEIHRSADRIGITLPDIRSALKLALSAITDIAADEGEAESDLSVTVSVRDASKALVLQVSLLALPRAETTGRAQPAAAEITAPTPQRWIA